MIPGSEHIEKEVLSYITPTATQKKELETAIETLKKKVLEEIKKTKIATTIELVGSTAKDTYIQNSVDIDLFLVFPATIPRNTLEKEGLRIGRALLESQEECFAEHPYVRGIFQGYKTELVPCYKIENASQKLSAVDRTPLHTKYIKEHLKEGQKKDVRLFKQFLKGIGCYGAEAEIEGFSGYLCEIMILKYGTFQLLIENVPLWSHGETLSLRTGTHPHFDSPLTFIDPVDPQRNVASALSTEKFNFFIHACKEYKQSPRLTFFFPNELQVWSNKKIREEIGPNQFIGVKLPKPDIIAENLYPQVRKAVRSITELCLQYDFNILDAAFSIQKENVIIVLHPENKNLSKVVLHGGPPARLKKNADEFIKKWLHNPRTIKKPFEKDKRLYVEIEREYSDIRDLLQQQVTHLSLGKHIDLVIRKGFTVLTHDDLLTDDLRFFWTTYFDKRMPWER